MEPAAPVAQASVEGGGVAEPAVKEQTEGNITANTVETTDNTTDNSSETTVNFAAAAANVDESIDNSDEVYSVEELAAGFAAADWSPDAVQPAWLSEDLSEEDVDLDNDGIP